MDAPTPETFQMCAGRTGCSNWDSLEMGTTTTGLSSGQCSIACFETHGCVAFNYQPGPCSGDEHVGKGACMLFSGECEQEANPCWDLYTTGGCGDGATPSSPSPFSPSPLSPSSSPSSLSPSSPSPLSPSPSSPSPFSPSPSSPSPSSPSPGAATTVATTTTAATTTAATTAATTT